MRRLLCIALFFCQLSGPASGQEALQRFSHSEIHMAVDFEVVLYASDAMKAEAALSKAMQRIAEIDKRLSDYDLESELSKLSETSVRREGTALPPAPVTVSDDLWRVLHQAQRVSEASGGAFDMTVGPLTKLWRRARRWKELPEPEALAAARQSVGYQSLQLDSKARTAQLLKPNMRLDLGGIAKGYAADEAVKTLAACGISRALVRASGDIAVGDPPPGQRGWRIGIAPLDPNEPPTQFVELANCGISTTGDAQQHLVLSGRRYSHIIDPRSGEPLNGRSAVTIIAPTATLADGLATSASVLGPAHSLALIAKFAGSEIFMVWEDESGRQQIVKSSRFQP